MDTQSKPIPLDVDAIESDQHTSQALALQLLREQERLPVFIRDSAEENDSGEPLSVESWYAFASELCAMEESESNRLSCLFSKAETSNSEQSITPLLIACQDVIAIEEAHFLAATSNTRTLQASDLKREKHRIVATCLQANDPTDFLQDSHYCLDTRTPSFLFSSEFSVGNAAAEISHIDVDFGDGQGMRRMERDKPVKANFKRAGNYKVEVLLHFIDGSMSESNCELEILKTEQLKANATDKVFIFAGGYSPNVTNKPHGTDLIKAPLVADGWTDVPLNGYDHKNATIQLNAQRLIDSLLAYQESNPINSICVMGFSMGGLVARMAVAMMNLRYPDLYDKVCALVPIDAPLEGANLGLSTQMFMRFASKKWKVNIPQEKGLDSDPAKQMLFLWTKKMGKDNELCFYHPHSLRTELVNELAGFYPTDKAIICLSCGSGVGKRQKGMTPGCTVFHWSKGWKSWQAYVELYSVPDKSKKALAEFYRLDKDHATQYTYSSTWNDGRYSFEDASGSVSSYNDSLAKSLLKQKGKILKRVDTSVYIPSTSAMGYGGNIHDPMNKHQGQSPADNWYYIANNGAHSTKYITEKIGNEVAKLIIAAEAKQEAEKARH